MTLPGKGVGVNVGTSVVETITVGVTEPLPRLHPMTIASVQIRIKVGIFGDFRDFIGIIVH